MMMRWFCARIRRRYVLNGHCAMWVDVRYMELFGVPTWVVRIHHMDRSVPPAAGVAHAAELARGPSLLGTLWRAYREAPGAAQLDSVIRSARL